VAAGNRPQVLEWPAEARPLVSVVMPCLNEAQTVQHCIRGAQRFFEQRGLSGEVIVADNGSTDGSPELAARAGARVVDVAERGYGSALRGGIESARGAFIVIGDADSSYDFSDLGPFVDQLEAGGDLVMGNRFQGGIRPGAMPWIHRWLGNPILTGIGRLLFGAKVGDFHCGLRAFRKSAYDRLGLRATGMEFASEMVIQSTLQGLKISEVPTVLSPDGRGRRSHLRTWRDGWRHLCFMLLLSPQWLFVIPSMLLLALGGGAFAMLVRGSVPAGGATFDIHTLLLAGSLFLIGYQLLFFGLFLREFAVRQGYRTAPTQRPAILRYARLEVGLAVGALLGLAGLTLITATAWHWQDTGFGGLDPTVTMRQVVPGAFLLMLGAQTIFSSFVLSMLGIRGRMPNS